MVVYTMANEYKVKNEIPDLYHILGLTIDVCKEPDCDERIKKAYIRKAKVCHPDKHPGRKDVEEVFELLTGAYDILKNERERNNYNQKLNLAQQSSSDFFKLRKGASDYRKTLGDYRPPTEEEKINFKEKMKALDAKHGFEENQMDPISVQDAKKKVNDMLNLRAEQDRELKPAKIFGDKPNMAKFNAYFDKVHRKDEVTSILPHNGAPAAWNDFGRTANFGDLEDIDNLYVKDSHRQDTSRQNYGNVEFGDPARNLAKEDLQDLKGADYVYGHNVIGEDYYRDLKTKLRERQADASEFEKMKYNDFKRDDTAGYGIFDQLGFKYDDRIALDVDEDDISKKYEKLMAERQQDLFSGSTPQGTLPPPIATKISKKNGNQGRR